MRNFTLRKGFLGSKCGTHSSFKGFVMLVVMMLMMASSAMAEVIDGIRYMLDPVKKTATLLPKKEGKYSGDIIIPEKIKGNLDLLESKWGEMYPIVIKSWRDNWERLTEYFQYTPAIRKLIYTTNTVEGYHRQVRKVTKTKGVFPTDNSLEKLVYLAYRNIRKKWTMPLANWGQLSQQLAIKFGDRFKIM